MQGRALPRASRRGLSRRLLPNTWDAASARLVAQAGFAAVATTSAGVAISLGFEDHERAPPDEMFAAVARIARAVDAPVTADLEAGYGPPPEELVERRLDGDAVGCNLDDTDYTRRNALVDAAVHVERLAAVKAAARAQGVDIVLNARTDPFLLAAGDADQPLEESLRRARLYRRAGADCVFPILATGEAAIQRLVAECGCPVTSWQSRRPLRSIACARSGVARISFGSSFHRWAMEQLAARLRQLREEAV